MCLAALATKAPSSKLVMAHAPTQRAFKDEPLRHKFSEIGSIQFDATAQNPFANGLLQAFAAKFCLSKMPGLSHSRPCQIKKSSPNRLPAATPLQRMRCAADKRTFADGEPPRLCAARNGNPTTLKKGCRSARGRRSALSRPSVPRVALAVLRAVRLRP